MTTMLKPEFTRRIDLGHIIQAGMMLVAVGGGLTTVFWTLETQISSQAVLFAGLQQQVIQHGVAITQLQSDQRHVTDTLTAALSKLGDELAEIRVEVAKGGRGNVR